jgi:nucleoside-diphosphate-sugar epimerase
MSAKVNLVTGATGLLGSHVAEQLRLRGEAVRALVRPATDASFLRQLGVEIFPGDLQDPQSVQGAVAGADLVYHCAARVGDWGSWNDFQTQVMDATRHVVEACRTAGVGRLLHVSSVAVYGHPRPQKCLTEEEPLGQRLRFLDHYCRAKIQAETLARSLGPAVTIVRPSWIFGPRDRNSLPRLINALRGRWVKILGSGDNLLNLLYASDVADGIIRAANHPEAKGQAYHLCSDGEITQRQFLDALSEALGLPPVDRHVRPAFAYVGGLLGDLIARVCRWKRAPYISRYSVSLMARPVNYSSAKARQQLGWRPQVSPREGIERALAWFREQHA